MLRRAVTFPLGRVVRKPQTRTFINTWRVVDALILEIERLDKENTNKLDNLRREIQEMEIDMVDVQQRIERLNERLEITTQKIKCCSTQPKIPP
jgi:chromosome segregation ATPase